MHPYTALLPANSRSLRFAVLLIMLFFAAWIPRVLGLTSFVTIDERKWLARSANFYQAIQYWDAGATFQREHPGVTVMWAGAMGLWQQLPDYNHNETTSVYRSPRELEAWLADNTLLSPLNLLRAGRWWIVLAIAIAIAIGFMLLRILFGELIAALATLYVAWDPFFMALTRQLHPDGLLAAFVYLSLLLFLARLQTSRRSLLIAAGIVMGLAWLTKTPAILLLPACALIALFWRRPSALHDWLTLFRDYAAFAAIAVVTFVALWPAMWINPLGVLQQIATEMNVYLQGHVATNYFWGHPTDDPGLFFYPVAFLFRTTPATVVGLILAVIVIWRRWLPCAQQKTQRVIISMVLFATIFTVGMTLGAKKFDRYLLPVFPVLDIVAVLGWTTFAVALASWLHDHLPRIFVQNSRAIFYSMIVLVIMGTHGLLGFLQFPYYLTYYNPLTGGGQNAARLLFIGWGEGLDEAARWIDALPNADDLRVVSWYSDGPLTYFLQSETQVSSLDNFSSWGEVDYVIFYANQWQRNIPSAEVTAYFATQQPVFVYQHSGFDLVRIYDVRQSPQGDNSG